MNLTSTNRTLALYLWLDRTIRLRAVQLVTEIEVVLTAVAPQ